MIYKKDTGLNPGFNIFGGEDKNKKDYIEPAPLKWITGKKYIDCRNQSKDHIELVAKKLSTDMIKWIKRDNINSSP